MEILKLLIDLIGYIAWPSVILILILKFGTTFNLLIENVSKHLLSARKIRTRLGAFELESDDVAIKKEDLFQIVKENDPQKRLELYKRKFDIETIIKQLEGEDMEWPEKFAGEFNIPNAFVVWPYGKNGKLELAAFSRLEGLGLVKDMSPPSSEEYIGSITDKGKEVLSLLKSGTSNTALQPTAYGGG